MLTALIVDDEYEIREGLQKRFPWEEFGIGATAVADDGDTALQLALETKPDLIVTDIKMNRMSGLEFLRELSGMEGYKPESIVVSGYDDFELVKQALQIGVMDYILKPINLEELRGIVGKATDNIMRRRLERHNEEQLHSQVHFAVPKMREELLRELFQYEYDPYWESRRRHRLKSLELEWMVQSPLALILMDADDLRSAEGRDAKDKDLIRFGIGNVVQQTLEEEYPYPFALCMDTRQRWVLILSVPRSELAGRPRELAELCLRRVNQYVKVNASAAMRPASGTMEQLFAMYGEASGMLEQRAAYGGNRLFGEQWLEEESEGGHLSMKQHDEVLDLVKYGSDADIRAAMDRFDEMVKGWRLTQLRDIQQELFEWLFELIRKAAAIGVAGRERAGNPIAIWERLEQYDTLQSLREQTERHLLEMAEEFRKGTAPTSQIVSEAEKIIRRDYADGLTLQSVAQAVHVTPVWLSKLFKKEKSMTFLEYLTAIRIEKAKEMLGDVQYKVYQISYQVGYKDPVHFSKLFKKQVGCTPKEFRRQRGIADE